MRSSTSPAPLRRVRAALSLALAVPPLLVDPLAPLGGPQGALLAGIEGYLRHDPSIGPDDLASAPQAMLQWTLH